MNQSEAMEVLGNVPFPHCDQTILHAPGECKYCDSHPDWQALRLIRGIAFTGHLCAETEARLPCPSDYHRGGVGAAYVWPGNRPVKE